ncbi:hypothetical protein GCM10027093_29590 [Paraburkholderia jirisanensis]
MITQGIPGIGAAAAAASANADPSNAKNSKPAGAAAQDTTSTANASGSATAQPGTPARPAGAHKAGGGGGASSASSADSAPTDPVADKLRQLIEQLKKQIASVAAKITVASRQRGPGGGPNPMVEALQGQLQSLEGALLQATAALIEYLTKSGQSTGLLNEQA